jgi:hypothetical protein
MRIIHARHPSPVARGAMRRGARHGATLEGAR